MWGGMQPHQNVKWERQEFLIADRAGRKRKEGEKKKPPKEINFFKYFALIGTQKVPRTVLMGVSVLDSLTFSPEKK